MPISLNTIRLFRSFRLFLGRLLPLVLLYTNLQASDVYEDYKWMLGRKLPHFNAAIELLTEYNDKTNLALVHASEQKIKNTFRKHLNEDVVATKMSHPCGEFESVGWVVTAGATKIGLRHSSENLVHSLIIGWSPQETNDRNWFCRDWYSASLLKPFKTFFSTSFRLNKSNTLSALRPWGVHFGKNWQITEEFNYNYSGLQVVSRNPPRKSLEQIYSSQSSLPLGLSLEQIKNLALKSSRVSVAVLDSGVDYNHPALAYKLAPNAGWDFVENDNLPFDFGRTFFFNESTTHGTAVASIAAGDGVLTSVVPIRLLGETETREAANFKKAIYYARSAGSRVINMSFGYTIARDDKDAGEMAYALSGSDAFKKQAIKMNRKAKNELALMIEVIRKNPDMLFVMAAGNLRENSNSERFDADDTSTINFHSNPTINLPNVLVVSSTDDSNKLSQFSVFGKKSVHLAAFGDTALLPTKDGEKNEMAGTSFAAPYVAHGAAYILAKKPHYTIAQVVETLKKSIVPTRELSQKVIWGGYYKFSNLKKIL